MLNSTTLEVAIGMALIYLLLSLFCTAINEGIAGILGSRAKNLERGIRSLFTEGALPKRNDAGEIDRDAKGLPRPGTSLADAIYGHGLVQSLYKSGSGNGVPRWTGLGQRLPSYIPARVFSSVLYDILFSQTVLSSPQLSLNDDGSEASTASGDASPVPPAMQQSDLQRLLGELDNLPSSKAKEALRTIVRQAGGDASRTRQAFERWFDDGMDRVAGWYKRKTQLVLFMLGLGLALLLNVDSIAMGRALWTNPALRAYSVAAAEQYAKGREGQPPLADASNKLSSLQSLALPLGWNGKRYLWLDHAPNGSTAWRGTTDGLLIAIAGWLLTGIAMTLGAPFWFDTLNQFMVVRSTIKPREKSEVEPSKDPLSK
jgi:hypothetical protein